MHNPRYAVSVVVEHAEGGSRAAAPVARDVLEEVLRLQGFATADAKANDTETGGAG